MTREDLNNKAWFRAIKVVFVMLFLIAQLFGTGFIYVEVVNATNVQLRKIVDGTPGSIANRFDIGNSGSRYIEISEPRYNTFEKTTSVILSFLIITLIFMIVRRIFFYIMVGEVPKFNINKKI